MLTKIVISLPVKVKNMTSVQEFFELSNRITSEYEAIVPLLRDPEVVKAARFLAELDVLASEYDFKPLDIMTLLDPGRAAMVRTKVEKKSKAPSRRRNSVSKI